MVLILQADHPTPKFGEALRNQVEERLNFFDSGVPPSKGADGLRKVLEELSLDEEGSGDEGNMDVDGGPALTTLEAEPSKKDKKDKKKDKKEKKDKKNKKRKSEDMDVDEDEEDEEPSVKKVKLSKEEKKALKKAKKEKEKEKETAEVCFSFLS
jgi:nucleolar protein 56